MDGSRREQEGLSQESVRNKTKLRSPELGIAFCDTQRRLASHATGTLCAPAGWNLICFIFCTLLCLTVPVVHFCA